MEYFAIIAIKGNYSDKANELFSAFDYVDNGKSKTYFTWTEAENFLGDNYFEYTSQDVALRGIWTDNGWTIIYDPEMVDMLEDEKIETLSKTIKADIWTILIPTTSGSFSFSKFAPGKLRHFFVIDGQIAANQGTPLPEEKELNISEEISGSDLESLAATLGFKIPPEPVGNYIVKYLSYNDAMKERLARFKQETKVKPGENKPWWKIW